MDHAFDPSIWEVKARGSEVQDHLWLHSKLGDQPGIYGSLSQKHKTNKQNLLSQIEGLKNILYLLYVIYLSFQDTCITKKITP